jgi:hypothetical protein
MDKAADHRFLGQAMRRGEGERIDAVESAIRIRVNRLLDGLGHRRIGGLPEKAPVWLRVSHLTPSLAP